MPTLSSNIVKREIASVQDVEDALARQSLYGGDLVTNLLELARVSEDSLTRAVAESVGLEPAPSGELPRAMERVRRLVPGDIAHRYALYPLTEAEGRLIVAVSEPLPGEVASDLEFSLGLALEQRAAPLVRVQQAVCRDYGLDLDWRVARVLARLNGVPDPHPTVPPAVQEPSSPPAAVDPAEELARDLEPRPEKDSFFAPRQEARDSLLVAAEEAPPLNATPIVPEPRAQHETLVVPPEPQELRAQEHSTTPSSDPPAQEESPTDSAPPHSEARLTAPPAIDAERPSLHPSLPSLPKLDLAAIARAEARASRHRRRLGPYTPAMAEADLSKAESIDDVMAAFFDFAAQYFEYSALFAVHGELAEGRDAHGPGAPRTRVLAIGVPLDLPSSLASATAPRETYRLARLSASGLDGALSKDLERRPGKAVLLLPIRVRDRAVLVLYGDHGASDVELDAVGEVLSFAPLVGAAIERQIRLRKGLSEPRRLATMSVRTAHAGERGRTAPSTHERALALATALAEAPLTALARISGTPVISVGPKRLATPPQGIPSRLEAEPTAEPHAAPRPVEASNGNEAKPTDSARKLELVRDSDSVGPEVSVEEAPVDSSIEALLAENASMPVIPQSRAVALGAHPLHPEGHTEELRLPSVIVDLANDTEELVEKLVQGDAAAAERLVAIGAAAVPSLVGAFPGPITAELKRTIGDGPARASDCGPVLKVLARIGPRAAPVLGVRTNDSRPDVRAWATRLLGEMPCSDASRAVARRFVDEDPEVRRAALAAGRMLEIHAAAGEALASTLVEMLLDSARKAAQTHMLIEALADLREARAIPALAGLLASGSTEVQRSAHWALTVLARTDYGDNAAAWDQWWRLNAARHRIEWLIDALMHESADIRRAAGDELKSVTKEYFGYYDDLPARERERAQRRYREWWETKGKARFGSSLA